MPRTSIRCIGRACKQKSVACEMSIRDVSPPCQERATSMPAHLARVLASGQARSAPTSVSQAELLGHNMRASSPPRSPRRELSRDSFSTVDNPSPAVEDAKVIGRRLSNDDATNQRLQQQLAQLQSENEELRRDETLEMTRMIAALQRENAALQRENEELKRELKAAQ